MEKIKVAAVSYLNTKPFLFGIERSAVRNNIELLLHQPSTIADDLLRGRIDVGLVPISMISQLKESHIISDFGICCDGEVGSVVICSQVPLEDSQRLFLDYQSRTSVALAQLLIKDFWKVSPQIIQASPGYEKQVMGKYAGLFIGDRALKLKHRYDYCYDLGEAWKEFTGRPFVFACWVANKKLTDEFVLDLNEALASGVSNIDEVTNQQQPFFPETDVKDYLTNKIQFVIDDKRKEAMNFFLQTTGQQEKIPSIKL